MKRLIILTGKAYHTIRECVFESNNRYETGGVLIGYKFGWAYLIVAVTTSSTQNRSSKVMFLLDGDEHTQKASTIISSFRCSPDVLGIWHSHICDGHRFSKQDIASNRILAKSLGGALSMLVTHHVRAVVLSASHISEAGVEAECTIKLPSKAKAEEKCYE